MPTALQIRLAGLQVDQCEASWTCISPAQDRGRLPSFHQCVLRPLASPHQSGSNPFPPMQPHTCTQPAPYCISTDPKTRQRDGLCDGACTGYAQPWQPTSPACEICRHSHQAPKSIVLSAAFQNIRDDAPPPRRTTTPVTLAAPCRSPCSSSSSNLVAAVSA